MKIHAHIYESVEQMLAACNQAVLKGKIAPRVTRIATSESSEFIGRHFESWSDLLAQANANWAEGQEIIARMLDEMAGCELPAPTSVRRRARWAEDGDELDSDRLRAGQQDCWRAMARQSCSQPRTISVIVNVVTPGSRDSQEVMWRGGAGVVLANLLEQAGYRVEFWATEYGHDTYRDGLPTLQAVCVKRADQPLDLSTLVNTISGWFYRTVFFQSYHTDAVKPVPGYGPCGTVTENTECVRELTGNGQAVVIDGIWNRAAALAKVREVIEQLQGDMN
jgi:hypothetical protein